MKASYLDGFKIIIFDFDGVIKDSTKVKSDAFGKLFEDYGEVLVEKIRAHQLTHGGISRYEKIPIYLQWAGEVVTQDLVDKFCVKFSVLVLKNIIQSRWVPGAREYLQSNYQRQAFILVTATPFQEIDIILDSLGIKNLFKYIYGSPTKKADAIAEVLTEFKCTPEDVLMIGDSDVDLYAAKENAVRFLLRRTFENQHLIDQYSVKAINDFLDIKGLLNE